jgi:2-polyprenyl-3-methyl-5-hydroxy-6-metoxy-1,4-benzoquinol methylase
MDLQVNGATLPGYEVVYPDQSVLRDYPCPICGREDQLEPIARIEARGQISLESAFCVRCQHRYHRRFPTEDWVDDYYRRWFERHGRSAGEASIGHIKRPPLHRRLRRRVAGLVRHGISGRPDRVLDFCVGALKSDGFYYMSDPSAMRVLEIGCGYGVSLATFQERGYEVYGLEANPVRAARCRELGLPVWIADEAGYAAVRRNAPFHLVYSKHVLEHIIDVQAHIARLAQLVDRDGYLYIETPDISGEILVHHSHLTQHVHAFSALSLCRLLRKHGFVAARVLSDNNVQVLAKKVRDPDFERPGEDGSPRESRPYESYVPYMEALRRTGVVGHEYRLRWDHYWVGVSSTGDGVEVFDGPIGPLHVIRKRNTLEMVVTLLSERDTPLLPVVFHHDTAAAAPVWREL